MDRWLSVCVVGAMCLTGVTLATAQGGKWELEERRGYMFSLFYKQSKYIDDEMASSELAFLCDQRNRSGIVGAILVPFDRTFENQQDPIPVSIQEKIDEFGPSDLLQKWKNGSEFLFSDVKDDVADLVALLTKKDAESDKSIHFYFPRGFDNGQQASDHIVVDASGFAAKFVQFEKGCASQ